MTYGWMAGLGLLCGVAAVDAAPLPGVEGETLLQSMPPGFKVAFRHSQNGLTMQEMIPERESVDNWSKMVTTQIFVGKGDWKPAPFLAAFGQRVAAACPDMSHGNITMVVVNGYVGGVVVLHCPLNPATGKPENIVTRAIQGKDSFYLVQVAYRFVPSRADSRFIETYLKSIIACDTRSAEHPCPDMAGQGFEPRIAPQPSSKAPATL